MHSGTERSHQYNWDTLTKRATLSRVLHRIRPTIIASPLLHAFSQRRIVDVEGLRLFIDPGSHLGQTILLTGSYEPDTARLFRQHVKPGDVVLDIGANEGFFSAMAAMIVGEAGMVIAVEPQSRLIDVLEINLALNAKGRTCLVNRLIGEIDDDVMSISLFPISNTGSSGIVNKYRFGNKSEDVLSITPATILKGAGCAHVDFVKVDVEGFEPEVVRSLIPLLDKGSAGTLLIDYHQAILDTRNVDPAPTHDAIVSRGYRVVEGDVGRGYVLYTKK